MPSILITGVAGFIGSHLAERFLSEGFDVCGIDNFDPFYSRLAKENNLAQLKGSDRFQFMECDIRSSQDLSRVPDFDVVLHVAAKAGVGPSVSAPADYIQTNLGGTQNILELMKERGKNKLLFASSSSVYGNNTKIPFSEADSVDFPISPYAMSKRSCELLNYTYHHLHGMDVLNLRFFTVFGPRQRPDLAIHKFVRMIEAEEPVTMYGDGSTARDYTYIKDIVEGVWRAYHYLASRDRVYEIFNIGNRHPIKLRDLISVIYEAMGKSPNILELPMQPGDVNVTFASIDKASRLLGYQPQTGLKEGITEFVKWYHAAKVSLESA